VAGDDSANRPGLETEPAAAATVFGDGLDRARRYAELLAGLGIERGLIGPREADRLWSRHLLNCAVLAELVPAGSRVVDIGSGAGLPGIPLALARPDLHIDLVEPLLRRSTFLAEVVADLGLTRCRVIRVRAEDGAPQVGGADVATARAVAPLAKLAIWAAPLLRPGGMLLALKGSSAAGELARDEVAVRTAGIVDLSIRTVGADVIGQGSVVITGRRAVGRAGSARAAAWEDGRP
jgi:16S rRNA (guanine527-N7)-methyltransferase